MNRLTARPARFFDCEVIAADIRPEDAEEIAQDPLEPYTTALEALERSFRMTPMPITLIDADGVPVVMGGITPCPDAPDAGCVWLLGTRAVERHALSFVRETRAVIHQQLTDFAQRGIFLTRIYNLVPASYVRSLSWLGRLGFHPEGEVEGTPPARVPYVVMVLECAQWVAERAPGTTPPVSSPRTRT